MNVIRLVAWMMAVAVCSFSGQAEDFNVVDFGAVGDGKTVCTEAIQKAIDAAAKKENSRVTFNPGIYRSGAIFIRAGLEFHLPEGAVIQAIQDDALYPERPTRVAGVEMVWPTALVNVYEQDNVKITGKGVIDGNGTYWWYKFWGKDGKSGMLADYRKRDLRWAVDYDCKRVRALAVYNSRNIEIHDVTVKRSGFWSVTLTYSEDVTIDGVIIRANIGGFGPSSDGIDIDSSRNILVQNCDIDCNDDNIGLKAGRDSDGLRVNRPTENITIRNCITRSGHGMLTLGSETSGGIRNVHVSNFKAYGTSNGIRIKSAKVRGGVIENIHLENIEMTGVAYPLHFELNWYPSYSYPTLPDDVDPNNIPKHWKIMTTHVEPPERGIPEVRDIVISNIKATDAEQAIYANAYPEKLMRNITLENVFIEARKAGKISNATDWKMKNVQLEIVEGSLVQDNCANIPMPPTRRIPSESIQPVESAKQESKDGAVRLGLEGGKDE